MGPLVRSGELKLQPGSGRRVRKNNEYTETMSGMVRARLNQA